MTTAKNSRETKVNNLENLTRGILTLALVTHFVTTPEQRDEWARQADWDHYVSKYTD